MPPFTNLLLLILITFTFGSVQTYAQVRLTPDEAEKLVIEKPEPIYPDVAKMLKLQGVVKVQAVVSKTGTVVSSKVIDGNPVFKTPAIDAVNRRKYRPYIVDGKPVPFRTIIELFFSLGIPREEYERDQKVSERYFKQKDKCRHLVRGQKWKEAEPACKAAIEIAQQFADGRELEKAGAYELFGYVMMGQKRYREALDNYKLALDVVSTRLTEEDAELGQLYGGMALAHHLLGDLSKARELYLKAEKIYRAAYVTMGGEDADEETENIRRSYIQALKRLLEYHLRAAEEAGATSEVVEIKNRMKSLP